jgi:uncharacterized membrane protein
VIDCANIAVLGGNSNMPSSRTEAFSDGVFAVAITLLVLNVEVPRPGAGALRHALTSLWPSYAAYVVSFITIGIMWVNHHAIFKHIRVVDRPLQFINLFLLMIITFIPFPTSLLGRYIQANNDSSLAAAVYGFVMVLMSIGFGTLWGYVVYHPHLLEKGIDPIAARATLPRYTSGILVYAACIGIAFISAKLTLAILAAIDAFYIFNQIELTGAPDELQVEAT